MWVYVGFLHVNVRFWYRKCPIVWLIFSLYCNNAETGVKALRENANMTLVIPSENAISCLPDDAPKSDAVKLADEMVLYCFP